MEEQKNTAEFYTNLNFKISDDIETIIELAKNDFFLFESAFIESVPLYQWIDPAIFDDESKKKYLEIKEAEKRVAFIERLNDNFRDNNPQYAYFRDKAIYEDPNLLLEFLKNIKKSHFKKCGISENGRYKELQKRIEFAEISLAENPIDTSNIKIADIWPLLRTRNIFTESELAAFYYLQNPKTEDVITDINKYYFPFGPYLFATQEVIAHTATKRGFELTKGNRKRSDRSKSLDIKVINGSLEVTQKKNGETAIITILNQEKITKSTPVMKLLVFLLSKASQQHFNPVINFPLQELVNIGMYSNIPNARAGFKNHIAAIKSLQIEGEINRGKRHIKQEGGVLFYHHSIDQNIVSVWVNEKLDIEFLASYYTMLPSWAWALSNNAFEILLYVFEIARVQKANIVNISLSIIREKLSLPTREEYEQTGKKWKPGQYVKQPIYDAVEEITKAIEINQDQNIIISKHYVIDDNSLEEWLKGYLTAELKGDYSAKFLQIKEKQLKIIADNTARKEAALAAAEAKKEAEKAKN